MGDDRLDWIFEGDSPESLESRYDTWAVTYDADHDQWGWRGPDMVAEVTVRHIGAHDDTATIIDAGCGTGKVGIALRSAGWTGRLTGLDLSQGMLDVAAMSGVYDELVKCSLYEIPLPDDHAAAAAVERRVHPRPRRRRSVRRTVSGDATGWRGDSDSTSRHDRTIRAARPRLERRRSVAGDRAEHTSVVPPRTRRHRADRHHLANPASNPVSESPPFADSDGDAASRLTADAAQHPSLAVLQSNKSGIDDTHEVTWRLLT